MRLTSVDRRVTAVLVVLLAAIALVAWRGDNVGVQIVRFSPAERAGPSTVVAIQFSEAMDRDSVVARLSTEPNTSGSFAWAGQRLIYRPSAPLQTGTQYTVTLAAGAVSERGRQLLSEQRFSFDVLGPRIAYLAPEDGPTKDIWMRDAAATQDPIRLTNSARGIAAFDVSPDGDRIVFAERKDESAATDLKMLDLSSREVRPLTNCGTFVCTNPVWSPDGARIAYERLAYSSFEPGISTTSSRVWVLDPDSNPPSTRAVIADPQTPPNYKPRWSPDGQRLAISQLPSAPDRNPGVIIVNLADDSSRFFATSFGSMAAFSPDGARLSFPSFSVQGGEMQTVLDVAELENGNLSEIPGVTQAHESLADWSPDGRAIVLARRTSGKEQFRGRQLFILDPTTGVTNPLVVDGNYDHSFYRWSPSGQQIVLQRTQVWNGGDEIRPESRAQIWIYDVASGQTSLVASNAFAPHWVQ